MCVVARLDTCGVGGMEAVTCMCIAMCALGSDALSGRAFGMQ